MSYSVPLWRHPNRADVDILTKERDEAELAIFALRAPLLYYIGSTDPDLVSDALREHAEALDGLRAKVDRLHEEMEQRNSQHVRQVFEIEQRYNNLVQHVADGLALQPPAPLIIVSEGVPALVKREVPNG